MAIPANTPDPIKVAAAKSIALNGSAPAAPPVAAPEQQAALSQAASRAGLIDAPAAFLKQQAAQISEPYTTAATQASTNNHALNNYMGSLSNAHNNYLSELQAAIPLVQADVQKSAGGQNINDMFRLLSLKNQMADQDYQNTQRQAAMDQQSQAKANAATQQGALNSIVNHPNADFRDTALDIINNHGKSLPDALSAISSLKDSDLQKSGVSRDELKRTLIQYFDPATYAALPPVAPSAPAAPQKSSGNSVTNTLGDLLNSFRHSIKSAT